MKLRCIMEIRLFPVITLILVSTVLVFRLTTYRKCSKVSFNSPPPPPPGSDVSSELAWRSKNWSASLAASDQGVHALIQRGGGQGVRTPSPEKSQKYRVS